MCKLFAKALSKLISLTLILSLMVFIHISTYSQAPGVSERCGIVCDQKEEGHWLPRPHHSSEVLLDWQWQTIFFCWQIHILLISYPWKSSILLLFFCCASRGGNGVYKGGGMQAFCHPFSSVCFPLLLFLLWSYHSAGCLGFTHHIPLFDWEQHYSLDYSFNLCSAIYSWCLSSSTHFLSYFLPISILLIQVSTSWFLL